MDSVSDILEHFCVIHLSLLSLILTLYVIIILESSYLCQIKKTEHSNKYLSSLQLGFGEIMIYKTLANIISVCLSPFPHSTFLSPSPFFFFFFWLQQFALYQEGLPVLENNSWSNIYESIWCILLAQDYHIFTWLKKQLLLYASSAMSLSKA